MFGSFRAFALALVLTVLPAAAFAACPTQATAPNTSGVTANSQLEVQKNICDNQLAEQGTPQTGIAQESGGVGLSGWLSSIKNILKDVWDSTNHWLKVQLQAGSAIIGKVTADRTTPGTTNSVAPITGQDGVAAGAGAVSATTQRTTLASDDPAVAALGATTGAAVITDANGTIQQYLRGLIKQWTAGTLVIGPGENHAAEVGGNQLKVKVAQTVTASSAYASGNAVGGLITFANAARVSGAAGNGGTSGILQSVAVNAKSAQTTQMDLIVFDANPTGTTCTDKSAVSVAAADFDKVIGVVHVTDWTSGGTPSVGQAQNQALPYSLASSTSLYGCLVTRSTPTFAATTDISVAAQLLRN